MSFNEAARQRACAMIGDLKSNPAYANHNAWGIGNGVLADQLEKRVTVKDGKWPDQGQTSLCGPAAFMFCLLQDRADMYVDMIIKLWLGQKASLGADPANGGCSINPSGSVQANTPAAVTGNKGDITAVDWISMASLRNDSPDLSPFSDYDHPSDQFAAITRPKYLKGWFEAAGATCLWDNTSEVLPLGGWDDLVKLTAYSAGWVLMLVSASMFANMHSSFVTTKNHWVVLNGPITINGRDISMYRASATQTPDSMETVSIEAKFFTWGTTGEQLKTVRMHRPDLAYFLKCFFGGIAFSHIP